MFTKAFWKDAAERSIATFAEVVLTIVGILIPVAGVSSKHDLETIVFVTLDAMWIIALAGLGGAVLALLKAIVAAKRAGEPTASLIK